MDEDGIFILVKNEQTGEEQYLFGTTLTGDRNQATKFVTGAEAAETARRWNDHWRLGAVPFRARVLTPGQKKRTWQQREANRFVTGKYQVPVWHGASWLMHDSHYTHVSTEDPSMVSYTPDPEHGEADKKARVTPDAYLRKFYGSVLGVRHITNYTNMHLDKYGPPPELLLATKPDDIVAVYLRSGRDVPSCMTHPVNNYQSKPVHPTYVYGAGDLALGYIDSTDGQSVAARALCWPEKKIFGRVFGHERRLMAAFRKAGYTNGNFNGARLLRMEIGKNLFVCPYIDYHGHVSDNGSHLIIMGDDSNALRCDVQNGITEGGSLHTCSHCGRTFGGEAHIHQRNLYCQRCWDANFVCCNSCDTIVHSDDSFTGNDDYRYCERCFDNLFFNCDRCNETHDREYGLVWNDERYCEGCYDAVSFRCDTCEERVEIEQRHTHQGEHLCNACLAKAATEAVLEEPFPATSNSEKA